jgi:predicted GIY-YIG superfamily endonuclease
MPTRTRKKIVLYVLRLSGDKYYVGQSKNPDERIRKHFKGEGSTWTRIHTPLEVVKTITLKTSSSATASKIESALTLELMRIFGADNVRGGGYTARDLAVPAAVEIPPALA